MRSPNVIFIWWFMKKRNDDDDDGRFVLRVVIVEMTGNIKGLIAIESGGGQGGRSLGNTDEPSRLRVYNAAVGQGCSSALSQRTEIIIVIITVVIVTVRETPSVQHERSGAAASAAVRGRAHEPGARRGEGGEAVRQGVPQGCGLHLRGLPLEEGPL